MAAEWCAKLLLPPCATSSATVVTRILASDGSKRGAAAQTPPQRVGQRPSPEQSRITTGKGCGHQRIAYNIGHDAVDASCLL